MGHLRPSTFFSIPLVGVQITTFEMFNAVEIQPQDFAFPLFIGKVEYMSITYTESYMQEKNCIKIKDFLNFPADMFGM